MDATPIKPFAVFRRELQLFEILCAVVGKDEQIQRLAYASVPVAVWSIRSTPTIPAGKTQQIHIKGKPVDLVSTGAVLTTENYPESIPIVYCSKTRYFPASIRGIRVVYMDGLDAAYFSKKTYGSKALAITFQGDRTVVVEKDDVPPSVEPEAETPILPPPRYRRPPAYEPEECDMVKVGSCLTVLFLFFFTAYRSNQSLVRSHPLHPLNPLNPFEESCPADSYSFFKDPYSAYYP